jgi:hypothetical protein
MKGQIPFWMGLTIILIVAIAAGLVVYGNFLNTTRFLQSETFMTISAPTVAEIKTTMASSTNTAATSSATSSFPAKSLPAWVVVRVYGVTGSAQTESGLDLPISWYSVNASNCYATGSWSGAKPTSGNATVIAPAVTGVSYIDAKIYPYGISCMNDTNGEIVSSTVQVTDLPELGRPVGPNP